MRLLYRLLWWCAGVHIEVLKHCKTDHARFFGLGGTVLFTAAMAGFAGGYAIETAFQIRSVSIFFGIFWGLLIFNLDRYIISTIVRTGSQNIWKKVSIATPRLLMAILLGFVISTPLELKLFEDEIAMKLNAIQSTIIQERKTQLDAEFDEINVYEKRMEALRDEITDKRSEKEDRYNDYVCECDGTCDTKKRGEGPQCDIKKIRYDSSYADFKRVEAANNELISDIKMKQDTLMLEKKAREDAAEAAAKESDGLLARLDALDQLTDQSTILLIAKWFISLLFVFVEITPVLFKLMSGTGPYDDIINRIRLEASAQERQKIAEISNETDTNIQLSSTKNKLRHNAELKGNEHLLKAIAQAQAEIAEKAVGEWKKQELDRLDAGENNIINNV